MLSELHTLDQAGYSSIFFDDATFTVDRRRTLSLCSSMREHLGRLEFACQTRAELIDPEIASQMALAGFSYVSFGLETIDESALIALSKTVSVQKHITATRNAVAACKAAGIRSCLNIIVGLQNESNESLRRTLDLVSELDPTYVSLSALAEYPHENPSIAHQYETGVSQEDIWNNFDEGWGAIHPYMTPRRAEQVLDLSRHILGTKLELV